ncbi:5305_t:CDS:1, partial [Funneliformis caledonium]
KQPTIGPQPTSSSEPPVQPTSEPPVPQPTYVPPVPQPTYVPPVQPPTNVPPVLQPTSPPPTTQSTEPIVTKAPISQHKGNLGDRCNNNDECLDGFICHENSCNKKNKNSSIKKAAIAGVIIIGASGGLGFIFFMYMKGSQLRKGHKQDYTPSMYSRDSRYSTDEMTNTNSFSNNSMTPRGIPITNHYDNLPPIGNRGFEGPRPGFYNYYNEGENIRQPPSTLQNYNRNHGGLAPARQFLPMNQGGLFPIRSIRGNYGDNDPLRDPNISENETMVISNESDPSIYSQDSSGSGTSLLKNRLIRENQRK